MFADIQQGTGQRSDQGRLRLRRQFGVLDVSPTQAVARVFQQGVLEAATGTEKGHALFAGKTNGAQRTLGRGIRAARHAPDAVVGHQRGVILHTVGGQPVMLDCHTQGLAGQTQRLGNGPLRGDRRIEVPHQSNLDSTLAVHALIPLLHGGLPATIRWRLRNNNWQIDKQRLHACNIESSTPTSPWCSPWCVVVPWRGPQTCCRWTSPPCSAPCAGWRLLWEW